MTVKNLIKELLEMPLESEVTVVLNVQKGMIVSDGYVYGDPKFDAICIDYSDGTVGVLMYAEVKEG